MKSSLMTKVLFIVLLSSSTLCAAAAAAPADKNATVAAAPQVNATATDDGKDKEVAAPVAKPAAAAQAEPAPAAKPAAAPAAKADAQPAAAAKPAPAPAAKAEPAPAAKPAAAPAAKVEAQPAAAAKPAPAPAAKVAAQAEAAAQNTCGMNCLRCAAAPAGAAFQYQCQRCLTTIYRPNKTAGATCDTDIEFVAGDAKQRFTDLQANGDIGVFGCAGIYRGYVAHAEGERCMPVVDPFTQHCVYYRDDKYTCRGCAKGYVAVQAKNGTSYCTADQKGDLQVEGCTHLVLAEADRKVGFCYMCERGLVLDTHSNKCLKESTMKVEGCLIQNLTACVACDAVNGYYQTANVTDGTFRCAKVEQPKESLCGPRCVMCRDGRCGKSVLAPFVAPFTLETDPAKVGDNAECLTYRWKFGRSYCSRCKVDGHVPRVEGDGATCGVPTVGIEGCVVYGAGIDECLMCAAGKLYQPTAVIGLPGKCVDVPKNRTKVDHCMFNLLLGNSTILCRECYPGYQLSPDRTQCVIGPDGDAMPCAHVGQDGKCLIADYFASFVMRKEGVPSKGPSLTACSTDCVACTSDFQCERCYKKSTVNGTCVDKPAVGAHCAVTAFYEGRSVCIVCEGPYEPDLTKENTCMKVTAEHEIKGCEGYYLEYADLNAKQPRCGRVPAGKVIVEAAKNATKEVIADRPADQKIAQCAVYERANATAPIQCRRCNPRWTVSAAKTECLDLKNGCIAQSAGAFCLACDASIGYHAVTQSVYGNLCVLSSKIFNALAVTLVSLVAFTTLA